MNLTNEEIRIKVAEACGWRRWAFGDPWIVGLRLADRRFGGYIRKCVEAAPIDSPTIKLDIDETPTQEVREILENYEPKSHWTRAGKVRRQPPDYLNDLNACAEFESTMSPRQRSFYRKELAAVCLRESGQHWSDSPIHATARQRCIAYLKTKGLIP